MKKVITSTLSVILVSLFVVIVFGSKLVDVGFNMWNHFHPKKYDLKLDANMISFVLDKQGNSKQDSMWAVRMIYYMNKSFKEYPKDKADSVKEYMNTYVVFSDMFSKEVAASIKDDGSVDTHTWHKETLEALKNMCNDLEYDYNSYLATVDSARVTIKRYRDGFIDAYPEMAKENSDKLRDVVNKRRIVNDSTYSKMLRDVFAK